MSEISNMEFVLALGYHIKNPCGSDAKLNYLREAKRAIDVYLIDPNAILFLETCIEAYQD